VVAVVLAGAAVFFRGKANDLTSGDSNTALTDSATTSQVKGQLTNAIKQTFSYNYTDLDATEKSVKELGDKVSAADKTAIDGAIASLKSATNTDDVNDIKAKTGALAQAALKLGEAVYGGQPGAGGGEAGAQKTGDDNVVDADFEEVKDDKKKSA